MIFITGATGFVGGHLVDHLLDKGLKLKCLVRSEKAGELLTAKGVEVVRGDITLPGTLEGILHPDDFVIHLAGIIIEKGVNTFNSIHVEGTSNLVNEAKKSGVRHFFYQSALGADKTSRATYLKTKAGAEEIVTGSGLETTIFRPSLIIGPWDGFTVKLIDMIKLSPVLTIPGEGKARFQPICIKDWLKCIDKVIDNPGGYPATYEIAGPEYIEFRKMIEILSRSMGREKPVLKVPMGLMKFAASFFGALPVSFPVTSEQLELLETDNICDMDIVEKNFGFCPVKYEDALKAFI
ncbi:MAG: NAD(P)H-binding protein [Nitrospirota bacterium]|nr:NAD(P)H-binding protein [Nitrospirota bacterium]